MELKDLVEFCRSCGSVVLDELFEERVVGELRGLYASKDLEEDTVLFWHRLGVKKDERNAVVSFETLKNDDREETREVVKEYELKFGDDVLGFEGAVLALMLSKKYGFNSAYIDWFPDLSQKQNNFASLMLWDAEKLKSIESTSLFIDYQTFYTSSHDHFKQNIFPILNPLFPSQTAAWDTYNLCASIVQSYSFTIDDKTLLVPLMDAFNGDVKLNNVRLFVDDSGERIECRTVSPVKAGEALLNTFGSMSVGERLLKYGYVEEGDEFVAKFRCGDLVEYLNTDMFEQMKVEWDSLGVFEEYGVDVEEFDDQFVFELDDEDGDVFKSDPENVLMYRFVRDMYFLEHKEADTSVFYDILKDRLKNLAEIKAEGVAGRIKERESRLIKRFLRKRVKLSE